MLKLDARTLFQPTILMALALMAVIVMMILPMPAWVLDVGLAGSFALAILIFTVTLFIERPLDFSAFPTILLASLMLRLALNVSSTKLIIGQGHTGTRAAGGVIEGFAQFVMGGSLFLGLVIFCVLLIVNFMVITKGAARMAEVSARFALDGMPGKQLAIDSDVAAGAITHEEAKQRRATEQAETTFFGSLDGASKFVKGDAIAGLLITLLNIVMGIIMGVAVHGMPFGQAAETYAVLTVGDGLVTQIPAVIISIASALLLARGGSTGTTDFAVFSQLGRYPAALGTVALLLGLFALVPGLPFLPFVAGAGALAAAAYWGFRRRKKIADDEAHAAALKAAEPAPKRSMGDMLDIDDIHVEFAPDLVDMVLDPATGLDARITSMRTHVAENFGLILPEMRLTDNGALPAGIYAIRIQGAERVRDRLRKDRVLALLPEGVDPPAEGLDVREPVYGAPARWIDPRHEEAFSLAGATVVTPSEVLATHLLEVIKDNLGKLITLKTLRRLLDEMTRLSDTTRADANKRLLDELIPDKVPQDLLLAVLRLLLEERVSIRNLPLILEAIAEARPFHGAPEAVCEHVRQRLGFQIIAGLRRSDGTLPLIQLAPEWEKRFQSHTLEHDRGLPDVALPPDEFNRLATAIADRYARVAGQSDSPALVTSTRRRRFLKTVVATRGLHLPVLSFEEIGLDAKPAVVGVVAA
ncbi:MAG: flagellar biosynthesis protein FlhA [Rhodobacteraceae bacterium]|nr:flagellar biosynthesis protein FlhA [Paracoccaceae bacterium]